MTHRTVDYWQGRAEFLERAIGFLNPEERKRIIRQAAGRAGGRASARRRRSSEMTTIKMADWTFSEPKISKGYGPPRLPKTHSAVNYQGASPTPGEFCGACIYFWGERTEAIGACFLVDGEIANAGRCDLYQGIVPVTEGGSDAIVQPVKQAHSDGDEWIINFPVYKADAEKRLVMGIVLQPDVVDAQGDIARADEVEAAAHNYLIKSRRMFIQHEDEAPDIQPVESYIAPAAFEIEGEPVRKGSWVMVAKVNNSGIWQAIKDGDFTGFSIRGTARREPVEAS